MPKDLHRKRKARCDSYDQA